MGNRAWWAALSLVKSVGWRGLSTAGQLVCNMQYRK